jgi:hypothetical protein
MDKSEELAYLWWWWWWGGFNLLRYAHENSNGSDYIIWMDMFNSFINDTTLIEVIRGGYRLIWINK